jgi:hypothetical protein
MNFCGYQAKEKHSSLKRHSSKSYLRVTSASEQGGEMGWI